MIKVIGDRIAEALAEKMHEDVRKIFGDIHLKKFE